jgi:uncharacterized nucleotidyltransferase DUF6036
VRDLADADRIRRFMRALGSEADADTAAYLTGGTTAVLLGWRATTLDIDLALVPERERLLRAIARLKDELQLNVELASPADFIPVPAGWEDRSVFIVREGSVSFFHYDLYAQALAKLERAHTQDLADVAALIGRGDVEPETARRLFARVEPELYRFPAIDPAAFARRVRDTFAGGL